MNNPPIIRSIMHRFWLYAIASVVFFVLALSLPTVAVLPNIHASNDHNPITFAISLPIGAAYSYGSTSNSVIGNGNITEANSSEMVNFSVSAGYPGGAPCESNRSLESIKREIRMKINRGNELVQDQGRILIGPRSGPRRIDQICSIFDYLVDEKNWTYVEDWTCLENFQYSNYTLKRGQDLGGLGKGDCDDFAILLCALVESVGASPRIVFAHGPNGGHAYTEVFLGRENGPGGDVDRMIRWLRCQYGVDEINVHRNLSNGDVWLNLDWWKEPGGAKHPGGPFFVASENIVIYSPDDTNQKSALTPAEIPPVAEFLVTPDNPAQRYNATFDASSSFDCDGNITSFEWSFGDGQIGEGKIVQHSYSNSGQMKVDLIVADEGGLTANKTSVINVNQPPAALFTFEPGRPMVNEQIRFDAQKSYDADGKIVNYSWEYADCGTLLGFNKDYSFFTFVKNGTFNVTLKVTDDHGAQSACSIPVNVSGAYITNAKDDDHVSQFFDLIGEYSLIDPNKSIWIFVKPEGKESKFFPQTMDSCHPHSASRHNGKWESRITLGGIPPVDSGSSFDIVVTLADEKMDQNLREMMYEWWCPEYNGSRSQAGFSNLSMGGVHEVDRISVIRSNETWNCSQSISDINIPGNVNFAELKVTAPPSYSNDSVKEYFLINGNRSSDALDDPIWVFDHCRDGRWYPMSFDNNAEHVTSFIPSGSSSPDWHIDVATAGRSGDVHDFVVVLASPNADRILNDFQKNCTTTGVWPGLLTIELPSGIDEKDRISLKRQ